MLVDFSSCHFFLTYELVARQPLKQREGKGTPEELEQLASRGCGSLHRQLKAIVVDCGGTYIRAPRLSRERYMPWVEQECKGDYSLLLDLERATGLFEQTEGMLQCLQRVSTSLRVLRCQDRVNTGKRDILLNVCEVTGFVAELKLGFLKMDELSTQTHRFDEVMRMVL